ncbi:MAG: chorismate synthase [Candidatus Micrarchaeia archaeon]
MDPFEFGSAFRIKVFGSSHGPHIGVEIKGCPAGVKVSEQEIQEQLDRRRPGQSALTTQRKEPDIVEIQSGMADGITTGDPICMIIRNRDAAPKAYDNLKDTPRPGHADFPARVKYPDLDLSGGAFFSGRMTACMVMAGAVAKKMLQKEGIVTMAFLQAAGKAVAEKPVSEEEIQKNTYANAAHAATAKDAERMAAEMESARKNGDSVGGVVEARITGLPVGTGGPLFGSLESRLSSALFAIPAVKGVEFGSGFAGARMHGSENNDAFAILNGKVVTKTNNAGGILGGLATGMPVVLRVAFKPTPSIARPQDTVNLSTMKETRIEITGRHDPCVAVRAVPVVESVAAICIADILLQERGEQNG